MTRSPCTLLVSKTTAFVNNTRMLRFFECSFISYKEYFLYPTVSTTSNFGQNTSLYIIYSYITDYCRTHIHHHHQSILPKGRSSTASAGTKAAVMPKAGLPPQTQESRMQFYEGYIGAVASQYFLQAHSLFSIWTDFKRCVKIPGAQCGGEESGFG